MKPVNVFTVKTEIDPGGPAGLPGGGGQARTDDRRRHDRRQRVRAGARRVACARTTSSSAREEWLLVLEGRPTLRRADGDGELEEELEPGDTVCFPPRPVRRAQGDQHRRRAGPHPDALDHAARWTSATTRTARSSACGRAAASRDSWSAARARSTTTTASSDDGARVSMHEPTPADAAAARELTEWALARLAERRTSCRRAARRDLCRRWRPPGSARRPRSRASATWSSPRRSRRTTRATSRPSFASASSIR